MAKNDENLHKAPNPDKPEPRSKSTASLAEHTLHTPFSRGAHEGIGCEARGRRSLTLGAGAENAELNQKIVIFFISWLELFSASSVYGRAYASAGYASARKVLAVLRRISLLTD
jgi:hypothetical protein